MEGSPPMASSWARAIVKVESVTSSRDSDLALEGWTAAGGVSGQPDRQGSAGGKGRAGTISVRDRAGGQRVAGHSGSTAGYAGEPRSRSWEIRRLRGYPYMN